MRGMQRWRRPDSGLLPALASLAVVICGASCGRSPRTSLDAGLDNMLPDMAAPESGPKSLALDFSATGCTDFDMAATRCDGDAPLTLTFTPVASAELTRFLWDFGDRSTPSSDRSPLHTYALPGTYDVTLVAGDSAGGTVSQNHVGYVNVTRASIGARCDVDQQCADGLTCFCGSTAPCRPILERGICTRLCDPAAGQTPCPDNTACANLALSPAVPTSPALPADSSTNDAWRRHLCLSTCTDDTGCALGLGCRDLLAVAPAGSWLRACFARYPLGIGERCGDATAKPINADCAGQLCADLGAFGRCSADCASTSCPPGTACAIFSDGRLLCLAACTGSSSCNDDPLLDCEAPGANGTLGFTIGGDPAMFAPTYCAPKRCNTTADCGPAGSCPAGGGQCQRVPSPPTN